MKLFFGVLLPILAIAATAMMNLANGFARSTADPKTVQISIISADQAKSLFKEFASDKDIPFKYPIDGCYARATEMSRIAEKENVIMGRVYAEGNLVVTTPLKSYPVVNWGWHVAPVDYVKQADGSTQLMVFDPSLFSAPVTVEQWKEKMLTPAAGIKPQVSKLYYGARYQYDPKENEPNKTSWDQANLDNVKQIFEEYRPLQDLGNGVSVGTVGGSSSARYNQQGQLLQGPSGSSSQ